MNINGLIFIGIELVASAHETVNSLVAFLDPDTLYRAPWTVANHDNLLSGWNDLRLNDRRLDS